MFYAMWPDRSSLLIDAADEDGAREIATRVAEGEAPVRVIAIGSGAVVLEVGIEDDDEDGAPIVVIDAMAPTADLLLGLEELGEEDDEPTSAVVIDLPPAEDACASELEDEDGRIYKCHRPRGHVGDHEADAGGGAAVEWSDED